MVSINRYHHSSHPNHGSLCSCPVDTPDVLHPSFSKTQMSKITLGSKRKLLATHYRCLTFDLFFSKPLVEEGGPVLAGRSKSGLIYYFLERNPSLCIDPCSCKSYSVFPSILCYIILTSHTHRHQGLAWLGSVEARAVGKPTPIVRVSEKT